MNLDTLSPEQLVEEHLRGTFRGILNIAISSVGAYLKTHGDDTGQIVEDLGFDVGLTESSILAALYCLTAQPQKPKRQKFALAARTVPCRSEDVIGCAVAATAV